MDGLGSKRESCEIAALLFTGDVITASKKGKRLLEFFCKFFGVEGAGGRCKPVEFVKPRGSGCQMAYKFIDLRVPLFDALASDLLTSEQVLSVH